MTVPIISLLCINTITTYQRIINVLYVIHRQARGLASRATACAHVPCLSHWHIYIYIYIYIHIHTVTNRQGWLSWRVALWDAYSALRMHGTRQTYLRFAWSQVIVSLKLCTLGTHAVASQIWQCVCVCVCVLGMPACAYGHACRHLRTRTRIRCLQHACVDVGSRVCRLHSFCVVVFACACHDTWLLC